MNIFDDWNDKDKLIILTFYLKDSGEIYLINYNVRIRILHEMRLRKYLLQNSLR